MWPPLLGRSDWPVYPLRFRTDETASTRGLFRKGWTELWAAIVRNREPRSYRVVIPDFRHIQKDHWSSSWLGLGGALRPQWTNDTSRLPREPRRKSTATSWVATPRQMPLISPTWGTSWKAPRWRAQSRQRSTNLVNGGTCTPIYGWFLRGNPIKMD